VRESVSGEEPLTPEQLWERLVIERGFLSSPSGSKDAYRKTPATLPEDISGPGAPVGKGYETFAIIQALNKEGRRVGLALGFFEGGGPDRHAEAQAMRGLRRSGPAKIEKGKMVVVVDTPVCPSCTTKLVAYAKEIGLASVDIYLPERQSMTSDNMATAKTSSRTAAMAARPTLHLRFQGLAVR
jgi:hypothetical protein